MAFYNAVNLSISALLGNNLTAKRHPKNTTSILLEKSKKLSTSNNTN